MPLCLLYLMGMLCLIGIVFFSKWKRGSAPQQFWSRTNGVLDHFVSFEAEHLGDVASWTWTTALLSQFVAELVSAPNEAASRPL